MKQHRSTLRSTPGFALGTTLRSGLRFLLVAACVLPTAAQPPVAPTTNAPVGIARGENVEGYNVHQSFEVGYRYRSVGGDLGMYRSTVNYGNGLRLLGSSLSVNSVDGHGRLFDQIQLNTQGLGNDPYQYATLRVEKNRLYRYDLNWRSNAYFNTGLRISNGEHALDTVRNLQDHDFTLFPQSSFKVFLGFSRNTQQGPALSTIQLFGPRDDEYPLFTNVRRKQQEYRFGFEAKVMGFRFNVMRGWVDFKDDTVNRSTLSSQGNNPDDLAQLDSFNRAEPYHGTSPYWRLVLFREHKLWAVNGRFTYVAGNRAFVQDETALGTSRFGAGVANQVIALGTARRPAAAGNLNLLFFPSTKLTISNQTSLQHIRMQGNSALTQLTGGVVSSPLLAFTFLGIRTAANATDLDWRPKRWLGVRAGYQYSTRRIRSVEGFEFNVPADAAARQPIEQNNRLHTALAGVRLKPVKGLSINLDGEIGRNDHPIYPVSNKDYHAFRGRAEYKRGNYRIAALARVDYNFNSASLASFASRSRVYGADGTWTVGRNFFVDLGYNKAHLDTLGAISYFANGDLINGDRSYYVSNLHTATLAARFAMGSRVDVSLGLSHVQDIGDGRSRATLACATANGVPTGICAAVKPPYVSLQSFAAVQTFPLRFTSPQGRVSVLINEKLRWNVGYQHYGYAEDFSGLAGFPLQNFRAHTGYTSLLWSF